MRPMIQRTFAIAGLTAAALLGPWSARLARAQGYVYPTRVAGYYSPAPGWVYYAYPTYTYPGPVYLDARRTPITRPRAPMVRVFTPTNRILRGYYPNIWNEYRD